VRACSGRRIAFIPPAMKIVAKTVEAIIGHDDLDEYELDIWYQSSFRTMLR
jgi:hypothetical protein